MQLLISSKNQNKATIGTKSSINNSKTVDIDQTKKQIEKPLNSTKDRSKLEKDLPVSQNPKSYFCEIS